MNSNYLKSELELNSKAVAKVKRQRNILSDLEDFERDEVVLPSSFMKNLTKEKKKEKKDDYEFSTTTTSTNEWEDMLSSFDDFTPKGKGKDIFSDIKIGKGGKKKKKKKGAAKDYSKEFATEEAILKNLQMDQSRFVESLQKKYDQMDDKKSSARGTGKYITDLISSITAARGLSMQIAEKIINVKKTAAELNFKERKEFGDKGGNEATNINQYASSYLKQLMSVNRNNLANVYGNIDYSSSSFETDDIFDDISEALGEDNRPDEVKKALKYENLGVKVKVVWYDDEEEDTNYFTHYDFIAEDSEGNEIFDYPLPKKTKMNINRSTNKATDELGIKYDLIISDKSNDIL